MKAAASAVLAAAAGGSLSDIETTVVFLLSEAISSGVVIPRVLSSLAFGATNPFRVSTKAPAHHQTFQNTINRSAVQSNHRCHSQNAQAIKMMTA